MKEKKRKIKLSKTSALHYAKLVGRSLIFLVAAAAYIYNLIQGNLTEEQLFAHIPVDPLLMKFIWIIFMVEMLLRFFPASIESMGCQKVFKKNYRPAGKTELPVKLDTWKGTFISAAAWFALNGLIGILFFAGWIDEGILLLIALAYSVCDMICILFFCPFQTWFMKNRCCTTCRIYNWDFAMMFTPFVFIPDIYTWSLLGTSLLLLLVWEITVRRHPERFTEEANESLKCANCTEKLCHHKTQLRSLIRKNKDRFFR